VTSEARHVRFFKSDLRSDSVLSTIERTCANGSIAIEAVSTSIRAAIKGGIVTAITAITAITAEATTAVARITAEATPAEATPAVASTAEADTAEAAIAAAIRQTTLVVRADDITAFDDRWEAAHTTPTGVTATAISAAAMRPASNTIGTNPISGSVAATIRNSQISGVRGRRECQLNKPCSEHNPKDEQPSS
jgi:hypothetical protein